MRAPGTSLLLFAILLIGVMGASSNSEPVVGLEGSAHDFSAEPWAGGDACIACHAGSSEEAPEAPLWNPSADFNLTFGDAVQDQKDRRSLPGNGTLVCMRCHDGTMAEDMFGGLAAPVAVNKGHKGLLTTGHGGTNHPVGIAYPQFDRDYQPMNVVLAKGEVPLPDGKVECISCHDPHNEMGTRYMLVKNNRRSALCLACHKK